MKIDNFTYKAEIPQCKVLNCDDTIPEAPVNNFDPEVRYGFKGLDDIAGNAVKSAGRVHIFKPNDDAPDM